MAVPPAGPLLLTPWVARQLYLGFLDVASTSCIRRTSVETQMSAQLALCSVPMKSSQPSRRVLQLLQRSRRSYDGYWEVEEEIPERAHPLARMERRMRCPLSFLVKSLLHFVRIDNFGNVPRERESSLQL